MKEENKCLEESKKIYEELFEAYLFAYPLVETVVYSREKTNTIKANAEKAPRNQFAHNANIWRPEENKPGGPNMDTVYSLTSLQLEDGAIVFHKPETDRFLHIFDSGRLRNLCEHHRKRGKGRKKRRRLRTDRPGF